MRRTRQHNRRTQRTRSRLIRSFIELALSRGYEQLSAAEVAARAGVGRSTLYSHFGGLTRILEASFEHPCSALAASVRLGAAPGELVPLLHHFRTQMHRNAAFFREPICSMWSKCLARALAASLRRDRDRLRQRAVAPRELLATMLAELQIAIIRRWLADPSRASAEAIAVVLNASARRLIYGS